MKIAKAYKVNLRLVPIPTSLITIVLKLVGKKQISERLFGSLQVDCNKARETLSWEPIVTMEQQLEKMAIVEQKSKND
jgi:nucleoside-diphosphate-sugar epimerase